MHSPKQDQPIFASTSLEHVREGMTVLDAEGRVLGTVTRLQMGDPQAATTASGEPSTSGTPGTIMAPAAAADRGPGVVASAWDSDAEGLGDVPDVVRRDLRRAGFIQVDGPGLEGANRFIPGDRIAEVSGDSVRLHPVSPEAAMAADVPRATTAVDDAAARSELDEPQAERVVTSARHVDGSTRRWLGPRALVPVGTTSLVLGSAGVAAWLYRRWRREQARPINRLRRATAQTRERLVDNAPLGGGVGAGAMLLVLLALARRARRDTRQAERADSATTRRGAWASAQQQRGMLPLADDLALWRRQAASRPSRSGLGVAGGLLMLSGASLLLWRRVRTGRSAAATTPSTDATAGRERVQGSAAIEDQTTLTVPVTREEVTIERHPVERQPADRPIGDAEHEELEVPVRAEQVTVEKLSGSAEELDAANRGVQDSRRISGAQPDDKAQPEHGGDAAAGGPA
jgi:uncharacterized protein (TIGR02271 family)